MNGKGARLDWSTLSADQQRVMMSGIERDFLSDVLVFWMDRTDVEFSNRGYKYVPQLVEAAKFLIENGLLTLVPNQSPPDQLSTTSALEIVSKFENWWVYDPAMSAGDVEDHGRDPTGAGVRASRAYSYLLTDTNHGEYSIENWSPPTSMDHIERVD